MKSEYAYPAKITCPRSTGIVLRKRLFSLLDTYRKKPIIWVSGPAGSGKTTLISSYLNFRKLRSLWYQIDEGDTDIANFFYYIRLAIKKAVPRKRISLPLLTPEYLGGVSTFTKRYFEKIYELLPAPFIIVFDNYQDMPDDSPFHEIIKNALSVMTGGINTIFISRTQPPQHFARLKAYNKADFLRGDEIRFTFDETRKLLQKNRREKIPGIMLRQIQSRTDGWAAALVLFREGIKREAISFQSIPAISGEEFFDYFLTEVFEKTDAGTQSFLLKTAFLPYMTPQITEKLTGASNAFQILSELDCNNFFTTRHTPYKDAYQYHPLFRDFLMDRAKKLFTHEQLFHIRQTAALLLEKSGYIEDASSLFIEISDWENLAHLIPEHAQFMLSQGRSKTLEKWILSIPSEHLKPLPWLLYWAGICRLPYDTKEARAYFDKAFTTFDKAGDVSGTLLSWAGIMESIYLERSDFLRMDPYIKWIDKIMEYTNSFPSAEIEMTVTAGMISALTFFTPDYKRKGDWIKRAKSLVESDMDIDRKISIANPLYIYYIYIGDRINAAHLITTLKPFIHFHNMSPLAQIKWCLIEAVNFHMAEAMGEECLQSARQGMEIALRTGIHVMDGILLNIGAYGALTAEKYREMDSMLTKMSELIKSFSYFDVANYNCCLLCKDLYTEDFQSALRHARITFQSTEKTKSPIPLFLAHLGLSQALYETGSIKEAGNHLVHARSIAEKIPDFKWDISFLLPEAYMAFRQDDEAKGVELLRSAMVSGRKQGCVNILYWRPSMMSYLCMKALEQEIEVEYVQNLIIARNLLPPPREGKVLLGLENWPFPLKIYTLGRFEIIKDGEPMRFSGKTQQKPISMLKALIALGGNEVAEEQLSDVLWPDAEGDLARKSFDTTLYRLRRLIGKEQAIQMTEGRLYLNDRFCWVDIREFIYTLEKLEYIVDRNEEACKQEIKKGVRERIVTKEANIKTSLLSFPQAKRAGNPSEKKDSGQAGMTKFRSACGFNNHISNPEITPLYNKLFSLYRGHFLPSDANHLWSMSMRERLRSKFLRIILKTGRYWERVRKWEKAVECFQKGLEVDSLVEEFYQNLMLGYFHLGQKSEAIAVYNRCASMLSNAMGLMPSPKTKEILNKIRG